MSSSVLLATSRRWTLLWVPPNDLPEPPLGASGGLIHTDDEREYRATLDEQRHLYAWCLQHVGGRTERESNEKALAFYDYQPPGSPYRNLVFHDEAWHWAMLELHGDGYWRKHPTWAAPTPAYRDAESHYEANLPTSSDGAADEKRG